MKDDGRVTIKTIANDLGLSFSTVAKALNNDPLIRETTKTKILQKAKEAGYTPNAMARNLRQNETHTITVIFNDLENPILQGIFGTIAKKMAPEYTTNVCDSQFNSNLEKAHILSALANRSDIIILEPNTSNDENLKLLEHYTDKSILFGASHDEIICNSLQVDYELSGYLSALELLENKHTKIKVFTTSLSFPPSFNYVQGIKRAYEKYGLELNASDIYEMESNERSAFQLASDIFEKENNCDRTTGYLTFCDIMAAGIYKAAKTYNLRIPEDISVIGHDDYPLSDLLNPPLTTIHLPTERISDNCIKLMKTILKNRTKTMQHYSTDPVLVKRNSVKSLRHEERGDSSL